MTRIEVLQAIKNWVINKISGVDVTPLIPTQASTDNKLADKEFVNSSISTNTATFRGTFSSLTSLVETYSGDKDNNDYAFVITQDADGNTLYNRYKYNGTSWVFEYSLNNSSFTAAQWAAINSDITSALTLKLASLPNVVTLTQSEFDNLQSYASNTEYNIIEASV